MPHTRPYYAERSLSAAFYDTVTAADKRLAGDLEIYGGLAPPGGSILEWGFRIAAIDIAPAMLARRGSSAPRPSRGPPGASS